MIKKKVKLFFVFIIFLLVMVACSSEDTSGSDEAKKSNNQNGANETTDEGTSNDESVEIRISWWGGEARHEMMNKVIDMFEEENPNINVVREFSGWDDYWEKLATQTAGGNVPDVLHFNRETIYDYALRGVVKDLQPLVDSGDINLDDFQQAIIDSGKVDDTLYMITLGNSIPGVFYNKDLFEEANVEVPDFNWNYDEFIEKATAVSDGLGEGRWGTHDYGSESFLFDMYLKQINLALYTDGQLGFDKQHMIDWFTLWDDLRTNGASPPAEVSAENAGAPQEDSMMARGETAIVMTSGNQLPIFQQYTEGQLDVVRMPTGIGDDPMIAGEPLIGAYIGIAEESEYPNEAAKLINFMVNNLEIAKVYGAEHGPPGSSAAQEAVLETLDESSRRMFDHYNNTVEHTVEDTLRPEQNNSVLDAFGKAYEEVSFGAKSIEQSVDDFFAEAERLLKN